MICPTSVSQDLVVPNGVTMTITKEHVTFARFPVHSSCAASAQAVPEVPQYAHSQYLPVVSEAFCFHVGVE